jgi:general secretion pathway protein E
MAVTPPISYGFARTHGLIVLSCDAEGAHILMREEANLAALAEVRRALGMPLLLETVSRPAFDLRLSEQYGGGEGNAAEVVADVGQEVDLDQLMTEMPAIEDLLESQDEAPIIRMINALLTQAVRQGASDVHIEPYARHSVVRLRQDGQLHDIARPHRALHASMASRIKVMAQLDIAEKRLPQDGRIGLRLAGREVDVRVSTLPTTHGERIVLRLLDKGTALRTLEGLGMSGPLETRFETLLKQPHGIVLVTGPTGSGKSTTLYAALQRLDAQTRNIVTVEDPVEYDLPGVGQIHVNPKIHLSFAKALRAILRQDPDVIMIGEIRDLETAQIAVQASLTGHLVLATLHTNDAPSAVTRLVDMGIEPFLLASTLRGVLAQRLVRTLCVQCRKPVSTQDALLAFPELAPMGANPQVHAASGCPECKHSGYKGRTGLYELLLCDEGLSRLIHDRAEEAHIRAWAKEQGFVTLRDDGARLVAEGRTSVQEVLRVGRE